MVSKRTLKTKKGKEIFKFNYETLRGEFIPKSSSGLVEVLKNFNRLKGEDRQKFLNSLKKLEKETSPIFLINSLIRLNERNKSTELMKNSLELISFFYNDLSDEIQKRAVFSSLDGIDDKGFVTDAALSLISETDFRTFIFLSDYLYRGNKMLPEEKKRVINKEILSRFKRALSPSELITLFNTLSTYQIADENFKKIAYSYISSDSFVGKAVANYLISSFGKEDGIIAAAINREAAEEKALCSEKGYEVASMQFANLKEKEKKEVIKKLKYIVEAGEDEKAKQNIRQFFSDLSSYIKEKHLLSVISEVEKLIIKQEPHIKGKVWKMRLELMDSIRDIFNSKPNPSKFSKVEKIMKEMGFEQPQISNLKNKIKEELKNSDSEISYFRI